MFKDLPDEAIIGFKDVLEIVPWGRSTHYKKIGEGTFPPPFNASKRLLGWNVGVVRRHLISVANVKGGE